MTTILTQLDWDALPVHTTAVLTRTLNGVTRTSHATRADADIHLTDGGHLIRGGDGWSRLFAESDTARTLFIPAGRAIDVSELGALLRRQPATTPLEIACGHRRFQAERWAENTGRTVGDPKVVMECTALDGDREPTSAAELLRFLDMGLVMGSSWGLRITEGSLLAVAADGLEWAVTGAEERDGKVLVTTDLIVEEPEDPSPRWTSVDEYIARANETAQLRHDIRYREDTPKSRVLQDIRETEESLVGLEATVEAAADRLRYAGAEVRRARQQLAAARYIAGVTDTLETEDEMSIDA